jgi:hypothetical protein
MGDESTNDAEDEQVDSSRPTTVIPKYKRGEEVVAWTEVDTEWWEHVQHAREVHEEVVATYGSEPGVEYIERGVGEETIAGHATTVITILVTDEATAKALDLPDEIDGIPLVVEVGHISDT